MQPTAVDEALIGEPLRLSNARESWLGHSFLPVAQRVAGDIIEQQVWGRIRGEKREKSRCPETVQVQALLASRHVAQSRGWRIAAGLSAVHT